MFRVKSSVLNETSPSVPYNDLFIYFCFKLIDSFFAVAKETRKNYQRILPLAGGNLLLSVGRGARKISIFFTRFILPVFILNKTFQWDYRQVFNDRTQAKTLNSAININSKIRNVKPEFNINAIKLQFLAQQTQAEHLDTLYLLAFITLENYSEYAFDASQLQISAVSFSNWLLLITCDALTGRDFR